MPRRFQAFAAITILSVFMGFAAQARAADEYTVDPVHSSVYFKISHLGLAWVHGRFNEFSGSFAIDPDDAGKCSFNVTIKPESVDTGNKKRDEHLSGPDFFNTKQFPVMSFKSTKVEAVKDGYQVSGDFTMHGVTKPVSFTLLGGRKAEFPKGVQRTGYSAMFEVKRSDFGMDKMLEAIGDDVHVSISFEGAKK
jgi:polyisoprenoid-binding protein YceI